tara:strand:- start:5484 stop:5963 length:480 start_codon:yes stop_codon:yes gene_type:complete
LAIYKPFFVPKGEVDLFDAFNEELIDEIIGQSVDIYKVSTDETNTNMYGEAKGGGQKTFEKGFRVNCLIMFNEPENLMQDELGTDYDANVEIYFHRTALSGSDFYPEIGDVVDWNEHYFEIGSVTEPQLVAGSPDYRHQVKALASRIRLSSINFDERIR